MNKRRRASSCPRRGAEGVDSDVVELSNPGPLTSRNKKKMEPVEIWQQLYDIIRSCRKEDGSLLCQAFKRNPNRRQEPQYYEVVSQPIDLFRIQQKLTRDTYEGIEELSADIELLVNNAKAFYKSDSEEYKDATKLWKLYNKHRQLLETSTCIEGEEMRTSKCSGNGSSSRRSDVAEDISVTSNNEDDNMFEELFNAVMTAQTDGRLLHPPFLFPPSQRKYPDYLNVIDSPMDLKTIAQKIQAKEYTNLNDLERDLLLMASNACLFNETDSVLYNDAEVLKTLIETRKLEIEQNSRNKSAKTSRRKRNSDVDILSSHALATMEAPPSDTDTDVKHSEDSGGDSDEDKTDNEDSLQWTLFETVWNHLGPRGTPMADPFWKLPSRRANQDYYQKIKNPISLNQIKNKIRRGGYSSLSEVAGDMNIVFENAKQYNEPTSKLYKYAVILQRLMQQRFQELLDTVQVSSSDVESLSSVKSQGQANPPRPRGRSRLSSSSARVSKPKVPRKKKNHITEQLDNKNNKLKPHNIIKHSKIWFMKNIINVNLNFK